MSLPQNWKFVEEAHVKSTSLCKLAKVRKTDKTPGAQERCMSVWQSKMLTLYKSRAELAFRFLNHFCVVKGQQLPWLQRHTDIVVLQSCPGQLRLCHLPVHEARQSHSAIWRRSWRSYWISCSPAGSHKASCLPLHASNFEPSVPNDKWQVLPFFVQTSPWHMPGATVTRRFIRAHHQQHWRGGSLETQDTACCNGTPVLTLVMDQGPTGMAAMGYLHSLGVLVRC